MNAGARNTLYVLSLLILLAAAFIAQHPRDLPPRGATPRAQLPTAGPRAPPDALPAVDPQLLQRTPEAALPGAAPAAGELAQQQPPSPAADPATAEAAARRLEFARWEAEQDCLRHARIEADLAARSLRAARSRVPITMYSTAWCGACKAAKAYLTANAVAFTERDIELDPSARVEAKSLNPRGSVPTIAVDGTVLVGWSPRRFEDTLDQAARVRRQ